MKGIKIICCISLISLFFSCSKNVTVNEFFKRVSGDKEYKKEVLVGEFTLECIYRPSELIGLSELTKGQSSFHFDQKIFEDELKKYENGCYFDLTVGLKNGESIMTEGITSQNDYAARLGELTYLFNKNCYIISDEKDTIKALTCNFSNTYGNSPVVNVLLVFPKKAIWNSKNKIEVVYADKTFGIQDKALFVYSVDEIKKEVPKITEQNK